MKYFNHIIPTHFSIEAGIPCTSYAHGYVATWLSQCAHACGRHHYDSALLLCVEPKALAVHPLILCP